MSYTVQKLDDNKVKLTVTIPAAEFVDVCQHAAEHISQETKIPGFRPGKASYDVVKRHVGEQAILEHAAEELIRSSFIEAMIAEDLETIGQPFFAMEKLAANNEFIYSATVSLVPAVTKLADWHKLEVKRNDVEPSDKLIDEAKRDLLRMRQKEVRAESGRVLAKGDKAVVNLSMKKDGVVLEGGESQNHGVYTNEPHYIEGFVDEILGLKEGDEKTFALKFPSDHYQKHIAGQNVDFTVKMNEIFTIETPDLDDEFAKSLNMESADAVLAKLRDNLRKENEHEEERRVEKAVLDLIADKSTFEPIPDLLVNQEVEKMVQELEHHVSTQGIDFVTYLKNIGKSLPELKLDFTPQGLQRIKVGLVLREIQKQEKIAVEAVDVDAELDKVAATFKESDENRKRVYEPQYREYIERQLMNRATIDLLKKAIAK